VLLGDELFYFVRFCRRGEEGADLFFRYLHVFQQLSKSLKLFTHAEGQLEGSYLSLIL
jgi:hypothetical protein